MQKGICTMDQDKKRIGRPKSFNRVELFYIQGHMETDTPEEIAKQLNIKDVSIVEEKIKELREIKLPNAYDLMITRSNGGKHSVAVMTPAASMRTDGPKKPTATQNKNNIHVINKNR